MTTLRFATALATVVVLTAGCSTSNDTAATVGDAELTNSQLAEIMEVSSLPVTSADDARSTTNTWIALTAASQFLAGIDIAATDADRAAATTRLETFPGWDDLSAGTREVAIDLETTNNLLSRLGSEGTVDIPSLLADAISAADVDVDPRLGTFDPVAGVVAVR